MERSSKLFSVVEIVLNTQDLALFYKHKETVWGTFHLSDKTANGTLGVPENSLLSEAAWMFSAFGFGGISFLQ